MRNDPNRATSIYNHVNNAVSENSDIIAIKAQTDIMNTELSNADANRATSDTALAAAIAALLATKMGMTLKCNCYSYGSC